VIRRTLPIARAITVVALGATSLAAQQVGYTPETSPFQDLRGKQALTLTAGVIAPGGDPAGVGPRTGAQVSVRYELLLTGPLWLQTRATYAPSLDRTYKDPLVTGAPRLLGTSTRPLAAIEAGFGMNLTGNKSWNGIVPQVHGALGFVTGGTRRADPGGYLFGNKFTLSYGVGVRIPTGDRWEVSADLTHLFWKYSYPVDYGPNGAAVTPIISSGTLSPWKGNLLLNIGMSRFFFR
jgi:hypothetical protein